MPDPLARRLDNLVINAFADMADYVVNTPEEVIQANLARAKSALSVSAEEAGANFRAAGRQWREHDARTSEEWRRKAVARQIAEESDHG